MLKALKSLFADLAGDARPQDRFDDGDYRTSAAALLIHAITIDGAATEAERARLHAVLKYRFNLDDAETAELIESATAAEGEAVDLYRFTSLIERTLDDEGRRRIIEMMWELIYADGRVNEFEDNVVWRVADLLHVPARDRIALRRQVAGESAARGDGDGND